MRTIRTPKKEVKLIEVLQAGGSVSAAARAAGLSRTAAYQWKKSDPSFSELWDQAVETGTDLLEDEAFRRAVHGTEKAVFYKGGVCGHVSEPSDTMLIFMLKARRREKYGDRSQPKVPATDRLDELIRAMRGQDADTD